MKPVPKSWMSYRKDANRLVNKAAYQLELDPKKYWIKCHKMISKEFRDGKEIPTTQMMINNKIILLVGLMVSYLIYDIKKEAFASFFIA